MTDAKPRTLSLSKIHFLFFFSGMSGLMYEVLWISRFGRLFGNSSYAIGTVLAVYMGGLGLGSYVMGRRADGFRNGLRVYALLELMIAVFALMIGPLLFLLNPVYSSLASGFNPAVTIFSRLIIAIVVMLPATFCMGATLPVLVHVCTRSEHEAGERLGELYGVNTFGAVAGCSAAGFYLLPAFGESMTLLVAASLNIAVVLIAWYGSRAVEPMQNVMPDTAPADAPLNLPASSVLYLAALATAGFASMGLEVVWSRTIALLLGSSVYAFTAMLAVLLAGIALGGWLAGQILKINRRSVGLFIAVELILVMFMIFMVPRYDEISRFIGFFNDAAKGNFNLILAFTVLMCAVIVLIPSVCMGMTIPFIMTAVNRGRREGRFTGLVYASNTFGGIAGSLTSGFLLLPMIGIFNLFRLCISLNLVAVALAGFIRIKIDPLKTAAVYVAAVFLLFTTWSLSPWPPAAIGLGQFFYGVKPDRSAEVLYHEDGVSCTVTVEEFADNQRILRFNGKIDASTGLDMANQIMSGQLPMFYNLDAEDVLIIGYGSGVSVGAVLQHPVSRVHCAELERHVIEADKFFNHVNHRPLEDPRLDILVEDGRNVVNVSPVQYDVISSEPSNPWIAGIANLFTQEFYRDCRNQLKPGGVMCQWLQAYHTSIDDFKMILKTFGSVFPYHALYQIGSGDFLMLGSEKPLVPDLRAIQERINQNRRMASDLKEHCASEDVRALLTRFFIFEGKTYDRFCENAPKLNRDAHNTLEYSAVRNLFSREADTDKIQAPAFQAKDQLLPLNTRVMFTGQDFDLSASLLYVGEACIKAGNTVVADMAYTVALKAHEKNQRARAGLVKTAVLSNDEMPDINETIHAIVRNDEHSAYDLSHWLFSRQRYDIARAILAGLVRRFPESETYRARLASAVANLGYLEESREVAREVLSKDPANADAEMLLQMMNRP